MSRPRAAAAAKTARRSTGSRSRASRSSPRPDSRGNVQRPAFNVERSMAGHPRPRIARESAAMAPPRRLVPTRPHDAARRKTGRCWKEFSRGTTCRPDAAGRPVWPRCTPATPRTGKRSGKSRRSPRPWDGNGCRPRPLVNAPRARAMSQFGRARRPRRAAAHGTVRPTSRVFSKSGHHPDEDCAHFQNLAQSRRGAEDGRIRNSDLGSPRFPPIKNPIRFDRLHAAPNPWRLAIGL